MLGEFNDKDPSGIGFGTEAKMINQGDILSLIEPEDGNAWGGVFFNPETNEQTSVETDSEYSGTLTITKLDFENNIISGTFEMTVVNPYTNQIVEITEGRFDTLFTQ